jgi:hypothetical protein
VNRRAPDASAAFSSDNPAIIMMRMLQDDPELLANVAARLGGKPEIDEDSFLQCALEMEPAKGNA